MYNVADLVGFNFEDAASFLVETIASRELCVFHPKTQKKTYAQCSNREGMANVITFSDELGENVWFLIQIHHLVDGVVFSGVVEKIYKIPMVDEIAKRIFSNRESFLPEKIKSKVDGIILSQARPYHFLYDQMVNVFYLLKKSPSVKDSIFIDDKVFIDRIDEESFSKVNDNGCYLFPVISLHKYHGELANEFHHTIVKRCDAYVYKTDLVLWFGITGQKRSWLEQVDGCVNIVKQLLKSYSSITLVVDGWTAYSAGSVFTKEDYEIFSLIKNQLDSIDSLEVINLIDSNYIEKIYYSKNIDFFVANSGTGSVIPHVFSSKKGVVHGELKTFSEAYNDDIKVVPKNKVYSENTGRVMNDSYSFHWSIVYNLLLELGCKGETLVEGDVMVPSKFIFSDLSFSQKYSSGEILRDIALRYEKIGDFKTALSLMEKALEQRPNGPFIKRKIEEYKKLLSE